MKTLKQLYIAVALLSAGALTGCNDFLDLEPKTKIPENIYLSDATQLQTYVNGLYTDILPFHGTYSYGTFGTDADTDNQADFSPDNKYIDGNWLVASTNDNYEFKHIYNCNYFLSLVLPRYEQGEIAGNDTDIRQYIGECYFLRAYEYFKRYQKFGDFPIIKEKLTDDKEDLVEASKRAPRNEVARFILEDLDHAIEMMEPGHVGNTRISEACALLLKSRVALYEGTFLRYFANTPFVPQGTGWPGTTKDYNKGYAYQSGSLEAEVDWFLDQAVDAAGKLAPQMEAALTANTYKIQQSADEEPNPYMDMFGSEDLSKYAEVLLWKPFSKALGIQHNIVVMAQNGDAGVGVTKGMVDGFLMKNGLPIYAQGGNYKGDNSISDVRTDRDNRLFLFLKEPGQTNVLYEDGDGDHAVVTEVAPNITDASTERGWSTGYALRKGNCYYRSHCGNGSGYTGSITFRGVEALLNYIEAYYERHHTLDAAAQSYWKSIRRRAGVDENYDATIAATDISKEAEGDWGAYSGGTALTDKMLYNIRRERRCELMAEALRWMDLQRWRSLDQMLTAKYRVRGFKLWNSGMTAWYDPSILVYGGQAESTVSDPAQGDYLLPYEKIATNQVYQQKGYSWHLAHYLDPLPIKQMLITSSDGQNVASSPIYQNPYWPSAAGESAEK